MKGTMIVLGEIGGREAAAFVEDGKLQDLLIDGDQPRPGTIYRALADRPVKGQGGMFLKTPDGAGFIRKIKGLGAGKPFLVQVIGYAEQGKAIPMTDRWLYKSRFAIATPGAPGINISRSIRDDEDRVMLREISSAFEDRLRGCGLILRSQAAGTNEDEISQDIERVLGAVHAVLEDDGKTSEKLIEGPGPTELAWRDWPAAEHADIPFEELLTDALEDGVSLPGGGHVYLEATRALVAVDVNTGRDTSQAAGLKANLAVARDLPRLLRIKGLGGQIVIDTAPMAKKDRPAFESTLRAAFRKDTVETTLVGWTPLGHFELQRKRDRVSILEISL